MHTYKQVKVIYTHKHILTQSKYVQVYLSCVCVCACVCVHVCVRVCVRVVPSTVSKATTLCLPLLLEIPPSASSHLTKI